LIISGGISGLAAGIALQRVGIEAAVFEKAPHITEVGAGLSLWSNAMGAPALQALSVFVRTRTFLSTGEAFTGVDFAALDKHAGALSICLRRAALQLFPSTRHLGGFT